MSCNCEQNKPWAGLKGFGYLRAAAAPDNGDGSEQSAPDTGVPAAPVERWNAKRDIIAGGVGFALPFAYAHLAPKKWPQANVFAQIAMVAVGYFGTVWAYNKFSE